MKFKQYINNVSTMDETPSNKINEVSFSALSNFMKNASKTDKTKYRKLIKLRDVVGIKKLIGEY